MKKLFALVFSLCIIYLITARQTFAATVFEDNFNSTPDNTFPSKWSMFSPAPVPGCSATWKVVNGEFGVYIPPQGGCADNVIPIDSLWQIQLNDYVFELDARFVSGTDHNIPYFIKPDFTTPEASTIYELHFGSPGDFDLGGPIDQVITSEPQGYPNGNTYHLKIVVKPTHVTIYINNLLVREVTLSSTLPLGRIGLRAGVGSDPSGETWFDNVKVTTDGDDTLGVPLIKQTDPLWANNIYDTAFSWTPGSKSIGTWGCALTSAVMVFKYNGITKTPTGEDLTPGTTNSWLQGTQDGYIRNGLLNWLALTRFSRLAKITNILPFDALEYKRINHRDDSFLSDSLGKKIPPILEEPGHFIVATGTDSANTTFFINDPAFARTTLNDSYNKNYLTMGTYTPVNSDLSYIMLVVDPNINITVTDQNGNPVGESFIQSPISDPLGISTNIKGPLKIYYYPKPSTGKYSVVLSAVGLSPYQLDEYLYDINGDVVKKTDSGNLNGTKDSYVINFDKNNYSNDTSEKITFDYIKKEIIDGYNQKKIKNVGLRAALLGGLDIAKNSRNKSFTKAALDTMILIISKEKKNIDSVFAATLISDIQSLKNSL